jgi:ATP-dependent Clp protease ATP-binding subunit ClpC
MNEMFSEYARLIIEYASDEARRLKHGYLGTEHLLLGLIKLGEGRAVGILTKFGLDLNDIRQTVEDVVQPSGETKWEGQLPITARVMKVLELSGSEARVLKSKDIETEHILLGILKEEEGVAAQILLMYDVNYKKAYEEFKNLQAT